MNGVLRSNYFRSSVSGCVGYFGASKLGQNLKHREYRSVFVKFKQLNREVGKLDQVLKYTVTTD